MSRKYSVSEIAEMYRGENPERPYSSDADILKSLVNEKNEVLSMMDRGDISKTLRAGQREEAKRLRQQDYRSKGYLDRGLTGVGASMMDVFMGIKQAFGGDTQDFKADKEAYLEASEGDIASGIGEFTGQMAATAPIPGVTGAKLASKVASPLLKGAVKTGTGAAVGAGMGATEYVDEGETRGKNTAYGALFGAGGSLAGMALKKMGVKAWNAYQKKMKDAPTQEIYDLAKKYDINLRASDITGEGKFTDKALERVPLGGMYGQAKKTGNKVQEVIKGERDKLTPDWDDRIQESLQRKAQVGRAQAKKNYDKVAELSSGNTTKPLKSIEKSNELQKEISEDVFEEGTNPFKSINEKLKSKDMTFEQLRKQRSKASKKMAEAYKAGKDDLGRMYKEMKEATEEDIEGFVNKRVEVGSIPKKNMIGEGKIDDRKMIRLQNKNDELKKAFHEAQSHYKKNVVPYKDNQIIKDMQTKTPDEIFDKYMKKGKGDKAENFYKLLDSDGKKALKEGFLERAFKGATDDIDDPNAFYSPKKLSTYFTKMADSKNRIFTKEELKHYDGFAKLMKHAERYGQHNEAPSNGMLAIPYILGTGAGAMLKTNPVGGSLAIAGGLLGANIATFMKTYGKRLLLASDELGSDAFENKLTKALRDFQKNIPGGKINVPSPITSSKVSAIAGEELTED